MNLQEVQERFKNNPIVQCLSHGEGQIDSSKIYFDKKRFWSDTITGSIPMMIHCPFTSKKTAKILPIKYSFFNDGDHIGELEVPSNSTKEEIHELGMEHFFGEAITQSDILLDFEVFEE